MAFMISEEERTPYGTPVLRREGGTGTVDGLSRAVAALNRDAGGKAFVWIAGEERPVGVKSAVAGPGGIVVDATPDGMMPPPLPAEAFLQGLRTEARGEGSAPVFVRLDGAERPRVAAACRLERIDGGEDQAMYVVTIELGGETAVAAAKDAEAEPPSNSDDVQRSLDQLVRASGRKNLGKEPLRCHIPSVGSRYAGDEEAAQAAGTVCVVDSVSRRGNHVELDLMSVSGGEDWAMQFDAGDQAADAVAGKCERLGVGLPLFFMYKGVPYAASEFKAENGYPPTLTLEPWADVDEGEIEADAARFAADGLI